MTAIFLIAAVAAVFSTLLTPANRGFERQRWGKPANDLGATAHHSMVMDSFRGGWRSRRQGRPGVNMV